VDIATRVKDMASTNMARVSAAIVTERRERKIWVTERTEYAEQWSWLLYL